MSLERFDLILVGGGLSSAAIVYYLCKDQRFYKSLGKKVRIAVFDKGGDYWRGVPYGSLAEQDFLLVENLENTGMNEFSHWIELNIENLVANIDSKFMKEWYERYRQLIDSKRYGECYFPRRWFGLFIQELMRDLLKMNSDSLEVTFKHSEITDLDFDGDAYSYVDIQQQHYFSKMLCLCIGSIPQKRPFPINESVRRHPRYISNELICAHFNLYERLFFPVKNSPGCVDIVILGSSASAVEVLYYLSSRPELNSKVGNIVLLSKCGHLVDGITADNYVENKGVSLSTDRPTSDHYLAYVLKLIKAGKINFVQCLVENVDFLDNRFCVSVVDSTDNRSSIEFSGDFVINCTGRGSIENSTSLLLNKLASKFPVEPGLRGFEVGGNNEVRGSKGFFINGPLLNRGELKQVESIRGVFREANIIAKELINRFCRASEKTLESV